MDLRNSQDENLTKAVAYFSIGNELRKKGHHAKAIEVYEKALLLAPEKAQIHNNLGLSYLKKGSFFKALQSFLKAVGIDEDAPEFHHNLGLTHKQLGQMDEAVQAYERSITKNMDLPLLKAQSCLNLAVIYKQRGEKNAAVMFYEKALSYDGSLKDEVAFMLAALGVGSEKRAPTSYIQRLFDQYAADYDRHLIKRLHYRAPVHIGKMLLEHMEKNLAPKDGLLDTIIDAGCGTGLSGHVLRGLTKRLIGIDLSSQMLNKAQASSLYDELILDDLEVAFEGFAVLADFQVDAIVATDVFNYFGELSPVFSHAKKLLKPNGCLIFSIESSEEAIQQGFHLKETARFSHDLGFVREALKTAGFKKIAEKSCILRYERDEPVWASFICAD